ncbi:MAG: BON domain-containing protein [Planctomycetota bacterium]|nr:MAG: BON domain-containing protein [Planctomycetota bacterium]
MLLPRKWVLSIGLLASAPAIALAGPFDGLKKSNARPAQTAARSESTEKSAAAKPASSNDAIAQEIANGMKAAGLKGKGIRIVVLEGVATLTGEIMDAQQLAKATQVASRTPGVETVDNQLSPIQSVAPARAESTGGRQPIQRVQYEEAAQQAAPSNQVVAQAIADQMASAGLSGYDIEIRYKNGACSLLGDVASQAEAMKAQQAAESVGGVQQVLNRLTVQGQPISQQQGPVYPAGLAVGEGQLPPGLPPQAMGGAPQMQPGMGYPGGGIAPAGHHMMYNQPNVPEYAWPTYAQNDNYAAVTYPSQYDASAFPYIGPFYPYPQVPMNWRQSTLEWKDGSWSLRFSTKTDKWWWFMQPKNWD